MNNRRKRRAVIKILLLFLMDIIVAGAIVYGYYWYTYIRHGKAVETIVIPTKEGSRESTADKKETAEDTTGEIVSLETVRLTKEESRSEETTEGSPIPDTENEVPASADTESTADDIDAGTHEEDNTKAPQSMREKFAEHFTSEVVCTGDSYSDENISVTVTTHSYGEDKGRVTYYLADIYVAETEYFGAGLYNDDGTFRGTTTPEFFAWYHPEYRLMTNGDYCGHNEQGLIVRNGRIYRNNPSEVEQCVMLRDGSMKIYPANAYTQEMAIEEEAWQIWCFGPSLLGEDGSAKKDISADIYRADSHPRTALGYYEPGHYCLLVADGREEGYSRGMYLTEMADIFADLGCSLAYNLDGGGTSHMYFNGEMVNHSGERYTSDFVVVSTNRLD